MSFFLSVHAENLLSGRVSDFLEGFSLCVHSRFVSFAEMTVLL